MSQQPVYGGVQNREREQAHQSQQQPQPWQHNKIIGENKSWPGNRRQPATSLDQLARVARGIGYVITAATLTKVAWWVWFVI